MSDPLEQLSLNLQAMVTTQKSKAWTSPALAAKLDAANASVAQLKTTFKLSLGATPSARNPAAKTDALSLGVGVSASTAASLKAGVSLGIGFSAGASISAGLNVNVLAAISLVAGLGRELEKINAASSALAGTNGVMPPGRTADHAAVFSALGSLSSKLDESQGQANALVPPTPKSPLTGEIRMPRTGPWLGDFATDDETPLSGKVSFRIDDLDFVGTVLPANSGIDGSRARCRVIGGRGGLSKQISGKSYTNAGGVKVRAVLRDILHDCGEDLSDLSDGPTLEQKLARWHVSAGPASQALNDLAEACGASWRVLRDGELWFGVETWPDVSPDHQAVDQDWSSGAVLLAPDTPSMVPGVVLNGQKVEHVTHYLDENLRTEVRSSHPAAALKNFLAGERRGVDYSREWPCKVVLQNSDGTLQLLPDDAVMKARGLDKVPIRYGMPGFTAEVKPGARCHLAFAAGDPSRPFAHNWEPDSATLVTLTFVGGTRAGARIGDLIQAGGPGTIVTLTPALQAGGQILPGPLAPCVGVALPYMISFSVIPPTPLMASPLYGAIITGQEKDRS